MEDCTAAGHPGGVPDISAVRRPPGAPSATKPSPRCLNMASPVTAVAHLPSKRRVPHALPSYARHRIAAAALTLALPSAWLLSVSAAADGCGGRSRRERGRSPWSLRTGGELPPPIRAVTAPPGGQQRASTR